MVEFSLTFLATAISTVIAVTMASIFFCCWTKKRSGELRVNKSTKEEAVRDKSRSPTPANGISDKAEVSDSQSTSRSDSKLPLLGSPDLKDSDDVHEFSAIQREEEILRPYRKPPPPKKKARKSRAPKLLKDARDSQDIFAELIEGDSRDSSDKENADSNDECGDHTPRQQRSQDMEKIALFPRLAETEQTLTMTRLSAAQVLEHIPKDKSHNDELTSPTGSDSPKASPTAKPRKGPAPAVSPKPTPKARSKPIISPTLEVPSITVQSPSARSSLELTVDDLTNPEKATESTSPESVSSQTELSKEEAITTSDAKPNTADGQLELNLGSIHLGSSSHDTINNIMLNQDENNESNKTGSSDSSSLSEITASPDTTKQSQNDATESTPHEGSLDEINTDIKTRDEKSSSGKNEKSEDQTKVSSEEGTLSTTQTTELQSGTDKSEPSSPTTENISLHEQASATKKTPSQQGEDVSSISSNSMSEEEKEEQKDQAERGKTSKIPIKAGSKPRSSSPKTMSGGEDA